MNTFLKDAIHDLVVRHARSKAPVREPFIQRLARELPEGKADLKGNKNYEEIAVRLKAALERGLSLTKAQMRDGAWCMWETPIALAKMPDLLGIYLAQLQVLRHKASARALAYSYLISFQNGGPGFVVVAKALQALVPVMGEPFASLQYKLHIFDHDEGPRLIGDMAFANRKPPTAILEENSMTLPQVLAGGYIEPIVRRVLQRAADDRHWQPLERLAFVQHVAAKDGSRKLYFQTHKELVANALLLPYAGRSVDKALKDRTLDFLIALEGLGDPRTKSGNWVNVPKARDIAVSWLTEQALRQFLDVVEAVNPNVNWPYRRRFWEHMHARGVIAGAWVVLDSHGVAEARQRFGGNVQFGCFTPGSGGIQAGHAVLLLRIGHGVCAEWSFNGKCRFWEDAARKEAPQLYETKKLYDADTLRTGKQYPPVEEIIHLPHEGPNAWQHKVAKRITKMTSERFNSGDYM